MDFLHFLSQLHLIRPLWLLALLPLALVLWLYARSEKHSHNWARVIDPQLLPYLLRGAQQISKKKAPLLGLFILGALLIVALAGPSFEKRPQPVFKTQSALVVLLDLSRSMDASDIKPSRLSRAHFKLNDILTLRREGQTALLAYAADAFVVSPLTDDAQTILAQVAALQTDIMPAQGSRLDLALDKAQALFTQAGHNKGHILILSDSIDSRAEQKIKQLATQGYRSSVLAIGTEQGAPIAASQGGFVKDNSGAIVVPKLNLRQMRTAALSGGGRFSLLSADDRDINHLLAALQTDRASQANTEQHKEQTFQTDTWREEGPWLLLLVIPFAAYAFRRGLVFALLIFLLPMPQPASAFDWSSLWNNQNQRGQRALQQGNASEAAELFNDPQWKAAAQYRAGDYQHSAQLLDDIDTAQAHYNRGNALARSGQLDAAVQAYDRAIELQPEHEDAKHNRELVRQAQQKQESQQDNQQDDKQDSQDQQQADSQQSPGNDSQQNQEPQQSSAQQSSSQSAAQQQNDEQENAMDASQESHQDPQDKAQQQASTKAPDTSNENNDKDKADKQLAQQTDPAEQTPDLSQQQTQQWLKKIPDDPGGLLRRKFKYQYGRQREHRQHEAQAW